MDKYAKYQDAMKDAATEQEEDHEAHEGDEDTHDGAKQQEKKPKVGGGAGRVEISPFWKASIQNSEQSFAARSGVDCRASSKKAQVVRKREKKQEEIKVEKKVVSEAGSEAPPETLADKVAQDIWKGA